MPRWTRGGGEQPGRGRWVVVLVLACVTVMTLDAKGGSGSPVQPLRTIVGNVIGPAESAAAAAVRPFSEIGSSLRTNQSLRDEVATLSAENSRLRSQNELAPLQRSQLAELNALTATARNTGYSLVAAHVIAVGPSQSFRRTVTIDAGTASGVRSEMTVLNGDGLVGRVVSVTATTATVLLIVDRNSTVGGRLGSSLEMGNVSGQGSISGHGALNFDLADNSASPAAGDTVVTWGSHDGVPYVAGIPIGRIVSVYSSPRNLAVHTVLTPFVDFSALDLVGVVVPRSTKGDRPLIGTSGAVK